MILHGLHMILNGSPYDFQYELNMILNVGICIYIWCWISRFIWFWMSGLILNGGIYMIVNLGILTLRMSQCTILRVSQETTNVLSDIFECPIFLDNLDIPNVRACPDTPQFFKWPVLFEYHGFPGLLRTLEIFEFPVFPGYPRKSEYLGMCG